MQGNPGGQLDADQLRDAIDAATRRAGAPTVVVSGTLRRSTSAGGPLVLDADDGTAWELLLPDGWRVDPDPDVHLTIAGDPVAGAVTLSGSGVVLRVRNLSARA